MWQGLGVPEKEACKTRRKRLSSSGGQTRPRGSSRVMDARRWNTGPCIQVRARGHRLAHRSSRSRVHAHQRAWNLEAVASVWNPLRPAGPWGPDEPAIVRLRDCLVYLPLPWLTRKLGICPSPHPCRPSRCGPPPCSLPSSQTGLLSEPTLAVDVPETPGKGQWGNRSMSNSLSLHPHIFLAEACLAEQDGSGLSEATGALSEPQFPHL